MVMKFLNWILRLLYATWCVISFVVPFLLLYPFLLLFTSRPSWYAYAHRLHRFWAGLQLKLYFIPVSVEYKAPLLPQQRYIFTPNHSSYIDIPLLIHAIPGFLNFVGKSTLSRVPLWGPIYHKLYITVDRRSPVNSARSYIRSKQTLADGRNLVIFPEGSISVDAGQQMLPFKDGPFKLAIETQTPVVPVSMPYNHIFLPDVDGKFIVRWHPLKMILHEPISTVGMGLQDLPLLKNKVYHIIQSDFISHPHEHRHTNHPQISPLSPSGI
jgi:1-acyl-sn-glycerol-3-phosphate acyltransferase